MSKDYNIAVLFDFYSPVLTEKQRDIMDLYYNEDFTLSEIAKNHKMTRQGAYDAICKAQTEIVRLEEKLMLFERFKNISKHLDELKELSKNNKDVLKVIENIESEL